MKLHHVGDYQEKRVEAYPSIGDQLDAIWKALAHIEHEGVTDFPVDVTQTMERVLSVKQKFPKVP